MSGPSTEDTWSYAVDDRDLTETIRTDVPDDEEVTVPNEGLVIGEKLGEGGMGMVSLGAQGRLRREVAVKQLKPGVPARVGQTLLREAWVTGALEHPNIVPVHDLLSDDDGQPQIVLKRIEGTDWQAFLDGEVELPEEAADDPIAWHLRILMQVCNAIEYAHRQGVLHRDLKPENVMIGSFGEVYVLDWGIAMGLEPDPHGRFPLAADQKGMVGTPVYMAPEMFLRDAGKLGKGTDIYLLGGILYRVLSGRPPRQGATLKEIVANAYQVPPLDPAWPSDLRDLLKAAFEHDPYRRPGAGSFRRALRAHLDRRGLDRLCKRAEARMDELRALLAAEPEDPDAHELQVHDTVGAVRFGLQEVLAGWPTHPTANATLQQLYGAMVEHELAQERGPAARGWLLRMHEPPAELTQRVEAQIAREAGDRERLAKLTADLDRGTGVITRMLMFALLAAAWVGFPIVASLLGWQVDYLRAVVQYAAVLVLLIPVGLFPQIRASRTNRGFWTLALISAAFTLVAMLLGWRWDLDIAHALQVKALCDAALVWVAATLFEVMLLPSALFYLAVVLIGVFLPEWINVLARLATLGLVANGMIAWPFFLSRRS